MFFPLSTLWSFSVTFYKTYLSLCYSSLYDHFNHETNCIFTSRLCSLCIWFIQVIISSFLKIQICPIDSFILRSCWWFTIGIAFFSIIKLFLSCFQFCQVEKWDNLEFSQFKILNTSDSPWLSLFTLVFKFHDKNNRENVI